MQREKEGGREGERGRENELVIILHREHHKGGAGALRNCKDRHAVHRLTDPGLWAVIKLYTGTKKKNNNNNKIKI